MAAPRPDWPAGFRSPPLDLRAVSLWRPLLAVLGAVLIPGLTAALLLFIAGTPGVTDDPDWLREQILFVVIPLAAAPFVALVFLPLLWPLVLAAAVKGWAGALSAVSMAQLVGLPVLHLLLHGDVTTETTAILPHLMIALAVQGSCGWAVFWGLMRLRATFAAPGAGGLNRSA